MNIRTLTLLLALLHAACSPGSIKGGDDDTDTGADSDSDTDSDSDSDTDTDTDTDTDSDSDTGTSTETACWQTGWVKEHPPITMSDLQGVWGSSPADVYAVGTYGTILNYDGADWTSVGIETGAYYYDAWGSAADDVFVVGYCVNPPCSSSVQHWDGAEWTEMEFPDDHLLADVWGSGPSDVFAGGWDSVYHFDGDAWTGELLGDDVVIRAVWASGPSDVYAAGHNDITLGLDLYYTPRVFHFDGDAWTETDIGAPGQVLAVWGTAADNVYAAGLAYPGGGFVMHKQGDTWQQIDMGYLPAITSLHGTSASDVYAISHTGPVYHYDGDAWTEIADLDPSAIRGFWATTATEALAVGDGGVMLHMESSSWTSMNGLTNADVTDVWGSGPDDVYAVDSEGRVLHRAGGEWSMIEELDVTSLMSIWGTGPGDIWTCGRRAIFHYDGFNWTEAELDLRIYQDAWVSETGTVYRLTWGSTSDYTSQILYFDGADWVDSGIASPGYGMHMWGAAEDDLYVIGLNDVGETVIWNWDGAAWTELDSGIQELMGTSVYGLFGNSATELYAWGYNGDLLYYDGAVWTTLREESDSGFYMYFWAASPSDIYMGSFGDFIHYDGDGWTPVTLPDGVSPRAIWGSAWDDVYVVGTGGILYYDGFSWSVLSTALDESLDGVWGSAADDVFVKGAGGVVHHFDGDGWTEQTIDNLEPVYLIGHPLGGAFATSRHGTLFEQQSSDDSWLSLYQGIPCLQFNGIWGTGTSDVFAVCDGGAIVHYDGDAWSLHGYVADDLFAYVQGVWGSGPDDVYVVGWNGLMGHWDGVEWTPMIDSVTSESLGAVWGTGPNNVYAVGPSGDVMLGDGVIFNYDGATWNEIDVLGGYYPDVFGFGAEDVFVAGIDFTGSDHVSVLHYDGAEWLDHETAINSTTRAIWGTSADDLYIVGDNGMILHAACE